MTKPLNQQELINSINALKKKMLESTPPPKNMKVILHETHVEIDGDMHMLMSHEAFHIITTHPELLKVLNEQ